MKLLKRIRNSSQRARIAIALVTGLILGCIGTILFQNYNPKDEPAAGVHESVTAIFGRIVKQNEMVSASQDYTFVEKAVDSNRLFNLIDIPFTQNSFWYRYSGTIKATVNLNNATIEEKNETTLRIILPPPYLENTPDMNVSGVLEETNNLFNPIHIADIDEFKRDCIARSNKQAEENGLIEEAMLSTEDNLQHMFDIALGENILRVEVEWVEGKEAKPE